MGLAGLVGLPGDLADDHLGDPLGADGQGGVLLTQGDTDLALDGVRAGGFSVGAEPALSLWPRGQIDNSKRRQDLEVQVAAGRGGAEGGPGRVRAHNGMPTP
jgi:hypothetical protein